MTMEVGTEKGKQKGDKSERIAGGGREEGGHKTNRSAGAAASGVMTEAKPARPPSPALSASLTSLHSQGAPGLMARVDFGEPVPSWGHPRLQPLCWWHPNHPFQPLPRGSLVPGQSSRNILQDECGDPASPLTPSPGHRVIPSPLDSSLTHSQAPVLFPFLRTKLEGRLEGWEQRLPSPQAPRPLTQRPFPARAGRGSLAPAEERAFPRMA